MGKAEREREGKGREGRGKAVDVRSTKIFNFLSIRCMHC